VESALKGSTRKERLRWEDGKEWKKVGRRVGGVEVERVDGGWREGKRTLP
jgi:hypothetical protein